MNIDRNESTEVWQLIAIFLALFALLSLAVLLTVVSVASPPSTGTAVAFAATLAPLPIAWRAFRESRRRLKSSAP